MATSSLCNSLLKWVSAGTPLCQRGGQERGEINTSRQRQAISLADIYLFILFFSSFVRIYFLFSPSVDIHLVFTPVRSILTPVLSSPLPSSHEHGRTVSNSSPPHTNMKRDKISWNSCACEETRHYGCPVGLAAASPLSPQRAGVIILVCGAITVCCRLTARNAGGCGGDPAAVARNISPQK